MRTSTGEDVDGPELICEACQDGVHQACVARSWTGDPDYLDCKAAELVEICLCPECNREA